MNELNYPLDVAHFQEKQLDAYAQLFQADCKYQLYGGAASGGKSYYLRWTAIGLAMYYFGKYGIRNVPIGLFSEDYPTLKDRQISRIKREVPPFLGELKETRDEGYIFQLSERYGAGMILLRNLDDPSKYASTEFAAVLVEELTKNPRETFDDLRFRMRFPGVSDPKFVGATNPGGIGHGWVKSLWIVPTRESLADPEFNLFKFTGAKVSDNAYVDPSYVKQLQSLPEQKRKAFLDGSWDVFAGQFFSEWNVPDHVINGFVPDDKQLIVGGMDWGRTNPYAIELSTIDKVFYHEEDPFYRAKTVVECYGTEKKPSEVSQEIKHKLKVLGLTLDNIAWIRCDPKIFAKGDDGSKSIKDQFIDDDERWRVILQPANNDRIAGWTILHDWLSIAPDGKPYWQVARTCPDLIRTFPNLIHDENVIEDVETNRKGGIDDDAGDAIRYQFKHLKWIGAKVGGIRENAERKKEQYFMQKDDDGKQIPINLDKFAR